MGPLDGIRVIEMANFVAAPAGGALMADMGADVIKIEPPTGDGWRGRPARAGKPEDLGAPVPAVSPMFTMDNRGKRSIVLDITTTPGAETARRLIDSADVFLTNLLPARRRRLGFDPGALLARNPRLIYVGVTGYGPEGPDADRPGFDYSSFWAASGIMGKLVPEDLPPPLSRPALGDHTTGLANLTATLAALRLRDATGRGQVTELSLFTVGQWVNSADIVAAAVNGVEPGLHDRTRPLNPLWNTYQCQDGHWLMLTMLQPDAYWQRFCNAMGHPDWFERPDWGSVKGRAEDTENLTRRIEARFATAPRAEWSARLDEHGIIYAPVSTVMEVVGREQTAVMRTLQPVDVADGATLPVVRGPFTIVGAELHPRGRAPELGEHTEAVLLEAGLEWDDITSLREQGAFGSQ